MTRSVRNGALAALLAGALLALPAPAEAGHRNNAGAAVAAGVIGAIIGGAIVSHHNRRDHRGYYYYDAPVYYAPPPRVYYYAPAPWTPEWYAYCARKYRSFDAHSGTFQPYYGRRRLCR